MLTTAVVALADDVEAPAGFPLRLVRYLTLAGHQCTLIWVFRDYAPAISQPFIPGIEIIYIRYFPGAISRLPDIRIESLGERLAPILRRFDIVYSLLPCHLAMHAIRERRFSRSQTPVFVTIATYVPKNSSYFGERYQAMHSDYFVCLGPHPERFADQKWKLPIAERVRSTGYQNGGWLELHREVLEFAQRCANTQKSLSIASPAVTVCVRNCFNDLKLLEATLDSLAHQNKKDFKVTVINRGGTSGEDGGERLSSIQSYCTERGWKFARLGNRDSEAQQPLAWDELDSDYLVLIDAGEGASPRLISRLLEGALLSGDDILSTWSFRIQGERAYDSEERMIGVPDLLYKPIGDYSNVSVGPSCLLVRTEVLRSIGGFPEYLRCEFTRQALHQRMSEAGYNADVVPDLLAFHRATNAEIHSR